MKQRDLSFDVLKGILILLVVLGHAYSYEYGSAACWHTHPFNFIYTFHMPLFIMVSGYFFSSCLKRGFLDNLKNKSQRLMLPWFVISTITTIVYFTSAAFSESQMGLTEMITKTYTTYLSLWFLPCIFCLTFFYYVLCKIKVNKYYLSASIALVVLFLYFLLKLSCGKYSSNLLMSILTHCQIVRQTIIFGIGIFLYEFRVSFKIKHWVLIDTIAIIMMICTRINSGIWILSYSFLERIVDGISCSLVAYSVLKPLCNWLAKTKISGIIVYGGGNSLGIYCIHHVLFYLMEWNNLVPSIPGHMSSILFFLGLTIVTVFIIEIIKRVFKSKSYIFGV